MQRIKPLIISRTLPYLGGREIIVDKLINFLHQEYDVAVLTPDDYPEKDIQIYSTNNKFIDILKWVKKQNITVINCHTFYLADLSIFLSQKLRVPLVFTLHGVFVDYYDKRYGFLLEKIYKNSEHIITVSEDYQKKLGKYIGESKKIITIKNGIDLKQIDQINKTKEFYRKKNKLPMDKYVVLTPARLSYLKGLDYLVKAVNMFKDNSFFMFMICSPKGRSNDDEITYKNKLKSLLNDNASNVKFINLDNKKILEYYKAADVILLPSLIEGISISLLEAMALSKIIITTRTGGNPEIIEDGVNGYLIKPRNANAILKILKEVILRDNSSIILNARKSAENLNINKMFDSYCGVFKMSKYENK